MLDEFYGFDVPDVLLEVASTHQRHVAELVGTLRSTGMDDTLVERSIDQLVASYRFELLRAVRAMGVLHRA